MNNPNVRPFVDTVRDIRAGLLLDELGLNLNELVQAVRDTKKGGKLTLTLEVKPMSGANDAFVVIDTVSLKMPTIRRDGTIMFPTEDGNLKRTPEKQHDLPGLRVVAAE